VDADLKAWVAQASAGLPLFHAVKQWFIKHPIKHGLSIQNRLNSHYTRFGLLWMTCCPKN